MTSKPSILYVNPTKQVRTGIRSLSRGLTEKANVTVFTPSDSKERVSEDPNVNYKYYNAMYVPGVRYTLPTLSFLRQLSALVKKSDLVHVYSYFYPVCAAAIIESRRLSTPSVVTVDSLPGVNWTSGSRPVDLIGRCYTVTLGRTTFKAANYVVALGDYLLDPLEPYVETDKLSVIPNGIDTEKFTPPRDESRADSEETKLLFVGRLDPVKGISTLLNALKRLSLESEETYRLTIVGDGTKRDEYESRCVELGIDDLVTFEGYQENVRQYYRNHDIFVLSSLSEGQPTVLLEAQSCGLPVISTDVGSASELVEVGETVPSNNSEALARAINSVSLNTKDMRQQIRSNVVTNYSTETMCDNYWALYQRLWAETVKP